MLTRFDDWISHLPFTGQRPTPYGPVDGIWYGLLSRDGDATAGTMTLQGSLTFARKEDWLYILMGCNISNNGATPTATSLTVNTGPRIPTNTTIINPSFRMASNDFNTDNLTAPLPFAAGAFPFTGMPIFGDKKIAGNFLMLDAVWELQQDLATYVVSAWGWLLRYNSFFRDRPASQG